MSRHTLEERVAALEQQFAELLREREAANSEADWFDEITGTFEDIPEFDEVIRLGHEIRQSDRPQDD